MKVLITGPNSYIGKYCRKRLIYNGVNPEEINSISLRSNSWMDYSFCEHDVVIHCAGLVHKNENKISLEDYISINTKLTEAVASKAKEEGVSLFVFFSTKAVYGLGKSCFSEKITYTDTEPKPKTKYGISKYEAEKRLEKIKSQSFRIAVIRPPMVYGNGCTGNYQKYKEAVLKFKVLPNFNNHLSMINIENLSELVSQIVIQGKDGYFFPQDLPIRSSTDLGLEIAKNNNCNVYASKLINPFVAVGSLFIKPLNSAFGGASYDEKMSQVDDINYQVVPFEEAVKRAELGAINSYGE